MQTGWSFLGLWLAAGGVSGALAAGPEYHRDVLPILRDYCVGCHNRSEFEGEFSVETHAELVAGGESGKAILVPGRAAESYLLQTMRKEAKPAMPPRKEPQPSAEEVAILEAWINAGAPGPPAAADVSMLETLAVPEMAGNPSLQSPVTALASSPDGTRLAVARHGRIEIVSAKDFQPLGGFAVEDGKINAIHWSADGRWLLLAGGMPGLNGTAAVRDAADGTVVRTFGDGHRDVLYDAEWSPDGKLVATAGYDRTIMLWDAGSGDLVRRIGGHNGAVFDLAFSPDSALLASASGDQTGKIWHVATGERLDTLNQPQGEQYRIAFTPDGKHIVGAGADNRIRVWRLVSRDQPAINPVTEARFAHEDEIVQFAFDGEGRHLVSASADGHVKMWTLPDLRLVEDWTTSGEVVSGLVWADGFVAADLGGRLTRFDPPRGAGHGLAQAGAPGVARTAGDGPMQVVDEDSAGGVQDVPVPVTVRGKIGSAGELDSYRFPAKAGEVWVLEVKAARNGSPLDSRIEVVTEDGQPIERVVLQAVRDSWFTFRGKDSDTSDDFRLQNWREMELNEYLYCNGEVVKLWHYPRGPDSGFRVYPGAGKRHTWFDTSPLAHALGQPCYIVEPWPAGSEPVPNGLPVYRLYHENDDDATRRFGKDSLLTFTAPADGRYLARVRDVRGMGGEDHAYEFVIRPPAPGFTVAVGGKDAKVSPGGGKELTFAVTREDGFEGEVEVDIRDLPPGFSASVPVTVQAGQREAVVALHAAADAPAVSEEAAARIRVVARARIGERDVEKELGDLGKLALGAVPKVIPRILPETGDDPGSVVLTIRPGETIRAKVVVRRDGFDGQVDLGKDDSGRNLPHGVYVDNIGLNGLMIPVGRDEQVFSITAAKWVPAMERWFHLHTTADGGQSALPVRLRVVAGEDGR